MRTALAAITSLSLALVGCSDEPPPPNDPTEDAAVPNPVLADAAAPDATPDATPDAAMPDSSIIEQPDSGPPVDDGIILGDLASEWNEAGTMRTHTFTPYVNGQVADLVWGAQGGIMVTPTIKLLGTGWDEADVITITIHHAPAPGHEDEFRIENPEALYRIDPSMPPGDGGFTPSLLDEDGLLAIPNIYDQLSGSAHDSWVRLTVTVEAGVLRGQASIDLHLLDPDARPGCGSYEIQGGTGCLRLIIPFTGHIVALRMGEQGRDGTWSTVVEYTASASSEAIACDPTLGEEDTVFEHEIHAGVREANGVEVGDDFPMLRASPLSEGCSTEPEDVFAFER